MKLFTGSTGRWYSHDMSPSVKKFLQRRTCLFERPLSLSASVVSFEMSTAKSWNLSSDPSVSGLDA